MNTFLRITGVGKLISFYRYIYINQPRLTRLFGTAIILAVGAVHVVEIPSHYEISPYLGVLFAANCALTLVAAYGIQQGAKGWGWTLGALISFLSLLGYLVSRLFGLPAAPELAGEWTSALGSVSMIFEAMFIAGWFSVLTGLAVASPDKHDWYD
jgi:pheromone shutdown protein TraB